ncbi:cell division protein SepF [Actinoplanes sp. NPDC051494]|uniref:cell division protein SepF n=1 Tax=Actinoplanes sp. NPDC051494 TaxID=3363907 RepID=UPI0037BD4884
MTLLLLVLQLRSKGPPIRRVRREIERPFMGGARLDAAVNDAVAMNEFVVGTDLGLGRTVGRMHQVAPVQYRRAAEEISRFYGQGWAVSVDLGRVETGEAARIADFCSGLVTGSSGWVLRAAETVIILVPGQ